MSSAIRCSILVHSLKLTGKEILVRSLPIELLRMDQRLMAGRWSSEIGSFFRRCL